MCLSLDDDDKDEDIDSAPTVVDSRTRAKKELIQLPLCDNKRGNTVKTRRRRYKGTVQYHQSGRHSALKRHIETWHHDIDSDSFTLA